MGRAHLNSDSAPSPASLRGSTPVAAGNDSVRLPVLASAPLERSWTEAEAFDYCSRLTRSHYENFPVGSSLIPKALQPAIHSLYAFMRTADDFSDEDRRPGDESERMAWLESWEKMLEDCQKGEAKHPIFIALRATLARHQLPVQWLRDLLHAFKMDVTVRRYATWDDLLTYCRYSANPVGRLILTLFGYRDEELYRLSDSICTALQLANHWQDVSVDLKKDRIYLPEEDMKRFGVTLRDDVQGPFRQLMAFEVARARDLFAQGRPLPEKVKGRLKWELRFTWQGGVRILDKIEKADYNVFDQRPVVTKADWLGIALRTLFNMDNHYVNTVARQSGSNFYFSFFSLPKEKREAITAVYAFCREVDDAVDAPGQLNPAAEVTHWREEIERTFNGHPTLPLTQSLAQAIDRFDLSRVYFDGILQGVAMDLDQKRYPTFESLSTYCYHVAGEVGLLCMEIFGYRSDRLKSYAVKLGTAFQLTNILRDVGADADHGRIYLPQDDLKRFGVEESDILVKRMTPHFRRLMAFETRRARDYYREASVLPTAEERPALRAAEMMRAIYENVLDRVEKRNYDVFDGRIRVPTPMKLWLSAKAWWETR